ncbi:MAG: ABC transporter ATP-binding protein [Candidatus Kariarchaeaceae archaeon]|jgi:ABC-type lipoprotein export system ATPase subunit
MVKEIIGIRQVEMIYGSDLTRVHALKDITFSVNEGDLVAITGPSGSGKSTLLHILGAMLTPTSGEVRVNQNTIQNCSRKELAKVRRKNIGFIFQNYALINHLSALDNVMAPLFPINPHWLEDRAKILLEKVGLEQRMYHKPDQLSGGERQRVAIARSLINNPSIVFGDEITGNLDSKAGLEIFKIIEELNRLENITFLIVTHDLSIAKMCRKRFKMHDGYLRESRIIESS